MYKDIPAHRKCAIVQSMFPSGLSSKENLNEDTENQLTGESFSEELESSATACSGEMEVSELPLERCMRIVPHDQNSGAFFIAVLQKTSPLPGRCCCFWFSITFRFHFPGWSLKSI
jgi:multisite-specific tRNA:(cytosine-C5)-methyltransferase